MSKTIAFMFEGTISPNADPRTYDVGDGFDADVLQLGQSLYADGHEIVVLTQFAETPFHLQLVQTRLIGEGFPFHEVWAGSGLPRYDVLFDNWGQKVGDAGAAYVAITEALKNAGV